MNDILAGIEHNELTVQEKEKFQSMMVTANLTIINLARKEGMIWKNRDVYRKLVLNQKVEVSLTEHEINICKKLSTSERNVILEVEAIKYRLLEGFVKLLVNCVSKKIGMAKFFTHENHYHIRHDLNGEAMAAFCHAVYRFDRYDIQFSTFLTTVVSNWLADYCERLSTVKLTEQLKQDLMIYYNVRSKELNSDRTGEFDQVIHRIILNELDEKDISATEQNVEEYTEQNHERFMILRQATNKVVHINNTPIAVNSDADFESLLQDLTENMTEMERAVIRHKVGGGGLQSFAEEHGVLKHKAIQAFQSAKQLIETVLAVA